MTHAVDKKSKPRYHCLFEIGKHLTIEYHPPMRETPSATNWREVGKYNNHHMFKMAVYPDDNLSPHAELSSSGHTAIFLSPGLHNRTNIGQMPGRSCGADEGEGK